MRTLILTLGALSLLPTYAYKLPDIELKNYACAECYSLSHDALATHWPIHDTSLQREFNNNATAKSYKITTTGKVLKKGLPLTITSSQAVIRITSYDNNTTLPLLNVKSTKNPQIILNKLNDKQETILNSKSDFYQINLKNTDKKSHLISVYTNNKNINAETKYIVSITDENIPISLSTDKVFYQYGDKLSTTLHLDPNDFDEPISKITGVLISPTGESIDLHFTDIGDGNYVAQQMLTDNNNWAGENGYIHAEIHGLIEDNPIIRQVNTAFSYTLPSAKIVEITQPTPNAINFSVIASTASRYALSYVLYHKINKQWTPLEYFQNSVWLGSKQHEINIEIPSFDANETYALGFIRLMDYGQMKTVYQYDKIIPLSDIGK